MRKIFDNCNVVLSIAKFSGYNILLWKLQTVKKL